jgi:predicted porin
MALAVAGALAAPAAALAQVQIGGSIHVQMFSHDPGNQSSEKKTDIFETTEPNIVISGEEKLAGGLSAFFTCESSFDVGGSAIDGFCGRNSGVGFKSGGIGSIFFGNWDTPHKMAVSPHRGWFGLNNVFARATILWNGAPSNVGNGVTAGSDPFGFSRRQKETLNWHGPSWGGFSLNAQMSGANDGTNLADSSPLDPRLISLGARFATGPLLITLGYEQHTDFNPTSSAAYTGGTDDSFVIGVGYTFAGRVKVNAVYTKNTYEVGTAAGGNLDADGMAFWVDWTIAGPHSVKAQYVLQNDPKGTAGTTIGAYSVGTGAVGSPTGDRGAEVMTLVYAYNFSKRTQLYAAYNQVKNDTNTNAFTLGQTGTTVGGKQTAIGMGMRYSF